VNVQGWRWVEEAEQIVGVCVSPPRQITIRWDEGDHGWYLSVIEEGRPQTMGQARREPRVFVAPLPLLAALTLVPQELHPHLVDRLDAERHAAQAPVIAGLQEAVAELPLPWPAPARARRALELAVSAVVDAERVALDTAAAGAWS
jgi:hypothetical protein